MSNRSRSQGVKAGVNWVESQDEKDFSEDDGEGVAGRLHATVIDSDAFLCMQDAFTPAERLCFIIAGEHGPDCNRDASAWFWDAICGNEQPKIDWLLGFVDGILAGIDKAAAGRSRAKTISKKLRKRIHKAAGIHHGEFWRDSIASNKELAGIRKLNANADIQQLFKDLKRDGYSPSFLVAHCADHSVRTGDEAGLFWYEVRDEPIWFADVNTAGLSQDDLDYLNENGVSFPDGIDWDDVDYLRGFVEGALSKAALKATV